MAEIQAEGDRVRREEDLYMRSRAVSDDGEIA